MKLLNLPHLYARRVRTHPVSELLAMLGIATGVALVFAVQVANTSVLRSVENVARGIAGDASVELVSRSPAGFDQALAHRIERAALVRTAAPLLEIRARVAGPRGARAVNVVGADARLAGLGGSFLREFASPNFVFVRGLALPKSVADSVGVTPGDAVSVQIGAHRIRAPVATVLEASEVGPLAASPIVPGPLRYVQRISGMHGRISRVLVAPEPDREKQVVGMLDEVADGRLDVRPSDTEVRLLRDAGTPNNQSTSLFAAISALVGFLFAFTAMLLTAPERRRFVAGLRLEGHDERGVLKVLVFEALALGVLGSALGLVLGDLLSRYLFEPDPGYLSFAFAVGDERVVTLENGLLACATGVGAALLANARPVADLLSRAPLDEPLRTSDEPDGAFFVHRAILVGAVLLVLAASMILLITATNAAFGIGLLVGGMLLTVAATLPRALGVLRNVAERCRFPMFLVAVAEIQSSMLRAAALAATAALAAFGAVAIGGSRDDLLRGVYDVDDAFAKTADVWVTAGGDENALTTTPFRLPPAQLAELRKNPSVKEVRSYRGGFVDFAGRRVWVIARPAGDGTWIPKRQFLKGNPETAARQLRMTGWAAIADSLATAIDASVGDTIRVPTPSGTASLRVAATVGNLGWAPGTLIVSAESYRTLWRTDQVTGLEIDFRPGVSPESGRRLTAAALGPTVPLTVETTSERANRFKRLAREGLGRLNEISTLVLVAAILALAGAMSGVLWQRRPRLAGMKITGFDDLVVWRGLLVETAIVLSIGCVIGAAYGLYGQLLLDRALQEIAGFPLQYVPAFPLAIGIIVAVAVLATLVAGVPGYFASKVPPVLGFQDE